MSVDFGCLNLLRVEEVIIPVVEIDDCRIYANLQSAREPMPWGLASPGIRKLWRTC